MSTVVIYHGGCRDGFAAAWVFNKHLSESSYNEEVIWHPGFYGQPPPDVKGKNVVILDFAYDIDTMGQIAIDCNHLLWIDHHKTALPVWDMLSMLVNGPATEWRTRINFLFNNDRSGAGLTWDYFYPDKPRPWLVNYVEDRDLWAKKLPHSDLVNAYISCLTFDFESWTLINSFMTIDTAVQNGLIAQAKTTQYVNEVLKNVYFVDVKDENMPIGDRVQYTNIPVVNICQVDCSEVLHELCNRYPEASFSLYWFKRADGMYQYGMRSIGSFDVSVVAKAFGGGGHKNAAGFQLSFLLESLQ